MPSIWSKNWSKIKEHWQWFLWGKRPYNELCDAKKQEARRDLYFRLFLIANAPAVANFYGTSLLSMTPADALYDFLIKIFGEKHKKPIGQLSFGIYCVLHAITMSAGIYYIVVPCYTYCIGFMYNLGVSFLRNYAV